MLHIGYFTEHTVFIIKLASVSNEKSNKNWKRLDNTYINIDLYPGKSKTVPPPILLTSLVRSLIKISIVQTNIRKTVRNGLHALSTYYMGIQELFQLFNNALIS